MRRSRSRERPPSMIREADAARLAQVRRPVGWPRAALSAARDRPGRRRRSLVFGVNALLRISPGSTAASESGSRRSCSSWYSLAWPGLCAVCNSGTDLMPPPVVPDARWLWDNEPCRAACPVHTDAGGYVTAIAEGRYRDAYMIARGPTRSHRSADGCAPRPASRHAGAAPSTRRSRSGRSSASSRSSTASRASPRARCGTRRTGRYRLRLKAIRRDDRRWTRGARGRVRPSAGGASSHRLRGRTSAGRDDGARYPRVSTPAA